MEERPIAHSVIRLDEGDFMPDTSGARPPLTIAILSSHGSVWCGLQKILECCATVPMVVHLHPWRTPDGFLAESRPDVVILDLETERDAIGTITQIREAAPTCKIVILCSLRDQDRTREAFAAGVDGIVLKVQPPTVILATIEALYAPTQPQEAHRERDGMVGIDLGTTSFTKKVDSDTPTTMWLDALTEREREIIRLVGQGLSNKEIAYALSISDSTVRYHMTSIFGKVGVTNRQKLLIHIFLLHSPPDPISRLLKDELHKDKESLGRVLPTSPGGTVSTAAKQRSVQAAATFIPT
jgi:DNA-binding NarL/FixJ family response regulator